MIAPDERHEFVALEDGGLVFVTLDGLGRIDLDRSGHRPRWGR